MILLVKPINLGDDKMNTENNDQNDIDKNPTEAVDVDDDNQCYDTTDYEACSDDPSCVDYCCCC
jgi:hypothetical protein